MMKDVLKSALLLALITVASTQLNAQLDNRIYDFWSGKGSCMEFTRTHVVFPCASNRAEIDSAAYELLTDGFIRVYHERHEYFDLEVLTITDTTLSLNYYPIKYSKKDKAQGTHPKRLKRQKCIGGYYLSNQP